MSPTPVPSNNPTLDKYRAGQLDDPSVQRALAMARQMTGTSSPTPTDQPQPQQPRPIASAAAPTGGLAPAPAAATPSPAASGMASPSPLQQKYQGLANSKSGLENLHPAARIPLEIANAIGTAFVPHIIQQIPGTPLHHQAETERARLGVEEEQKQQTEEATRQHLVAETKNQLSEAGARANPKPVAPKYGQPIPTDSGYVVPREDTAEGTLLTLNGQPVTRSSTPEHEGLVKGADGSIVGWTDHKGDHHSLDDPTTPPAIKSISAAAKPKTAEVDQPLSDAEVAQTNAQIAQRYRINHPGEGPPADFQLKRGATKADLANTERMLSGTEGAESMAVARKSADAARQAGEGERRTAEVDRIAARLGKPFETSVAAFNSQLDKISEAKAYVNGNASAQGLAIPKVLSALVSGQGSGVRLTMPELQMLLHARGITEEVEAWLQQLGSGKSLAPEQAKLLSSVLDDAAGRISRKQQLLNDALDKINGAGSREDVVKAERDARHWIAELENGRPVPGDTKQHQGATYSFDGKEWVKQANAGTAR